MSSKVKDSVVETRNVPLVEITRTVVARGAGEAPLGALSDRYDVAPKNLDAAKRATGMMSVVGLATGAEGDDAARDNFVSAVLSQNPTILSLALAIAQDGQEQAARGFENGEGVTIYMGNRRLTAICYANMVGGMSKENLVRLILGSEYLKTRSEGSAKDKRIIAWGEREVQHTITPTKTVKVKGGEKKVKGKPTIKTNQKALDKHNEAVAGELATEWLNSFKRVPAYVRVELTAKMSDSDARYAALRSDQEGVGERIDDFTNALVMYDWARSNNVAKKSGKFDLKAATLHLQNHIRKGMRWNAAYQETRRLLFVGDAVRRGEEREAARTAAILKGAEEAKLPKIVDINADMAKGVAGLISPATAAEYRNWLSSGRQRGIGTSWEALCRIAGVGATAHRGSSTERDPSKVYLFSIKAQKLGEALHANSDEALAMMFPGHKLDVVRRVCESLILTKAQVAAQKEADAAKAEAAERVGPEEEDDDDADSDE